MPETVSDINGGGNDYATLIAWEADKNGDITAGNAEAAELYGSLTDSANILCQLSGWTSDADSYIALRAPVANRRSASDPLRFGQGVSLTSDKATGGRNVIFVDAGAEFTRLEGLELATDASSGASPVLNIHLGASVTVGDIRVSDCVVTHLDSTHSGILITETDENTAHVIKLWGCVIYTCVDGIVTGNSNSDHIVYIYNCTINGCSDDGIDHNYGTMDCYNTISYNNTSNDFEGTIGGDYNMSEDATAPGANSHDSGTGGNDPKFTNTGAGTEDFHIASDSDAVGEGTDDPGTGLYSTDIDRQNRTSTWDMGADEYVAVGGNAPTGVFYGPLIGPTGGPIG